MYRDYWNLFIKGYGHLPKTALICLLSVVTSLIEGFNVGLLIPMLESLGPSSSESGHWISGAIAKAFDALNIPFELSTILLALGTLVMIGAGLKYLRLVLVNKLRVGAIVWLQTRYMWNLLNADLSYFHSQKLGVMTDTLTTQSNRAGGSVIDMAEIVTGVAMIFAYLVVAFLISPVLTAGAFVTLMVVSVGMQHFISMAGRKAKVLVTRDNDYQVAAVEFLSGIEVVKSFLLERLRWTDFKQKAQDVGQSSYEINRASSLMVVVQELVVFGIIGAIVFVGVSVLGLTIAVIVALLFSLYRLMPRFAAVNTYRQGLAGAMAAVRAVAAAIEQPAETSIVSGDRPFAHLEKGISLNQVSFSYNGSGPVLNGTSFEIETGKMTAIVGASGAGKSTLMNLLLRFYDPSSGSIQVDGVDLKELDLASWRRSIGIVSQDIFLFNDTVANNIALGRPGLTEKDILDASHRAYAHDFILELPEGYDTRIGDRGWNLSGGQRQRIALARAIAGKPEIWILDEATSALDSESEQLIQEYMSKIRETCTMVVVAHRIGTIRDADKIVVLQNGTIVEQGNWDSLLERGGVFAANQQLQSGSK